MDAATDGGRVIDPGVLQFEEVQLLAVLTATAVAFVDGVSPEAMPPDADVGVVMSPARVVAAAHTSYSVD